MAGVFDRMANNLKAFNLNQWLGDWLVDNEDFITDLNKKRLLEKGTDVDGKEIRTFRAAQGEVYSGFTIAVKERVGQTADRVTLKDTGDFHDSFRIVDRVNHFTIEADEDKPDGKISDNVNVESALGLADLQPMQEKLLTDLRKEGLSLFQS